MANNEQAVRDAAVVLKTAIMDATAAGYRVAWPGNVDGLDSIAISETGMVKQPEPEPASRSPAAKMFRDDTSDI